MKKLFAVLIFTFSVVYAQTSWSPPVQLSRDGVHPVMMIGVPSLTVDNNGVLYAFWVISPEEDGGELPWNWYSQIEYRRSTDGGLTWSATENLTPEYTTERIYAVEAVCDSKNNVHLIYHRGYEACKVMYKKYDGVSWSASYEVYQAAGSHLRLGIDSENRIYPIWNIGGSSYYTYCDTSEEVPVWQPAQRLHPTNDHFLNGIAFDSLNNLHAIGLLCEIEDEFRPYYYIFDRESNDWIKHEEIGSFNEKSLGYGIVLSNRDTLYSNVAVGYSLDLNTDNHLSKYIQDFLWSKPYAYSENNNWDREMYIDQHNYLHLFEKHYYEGDVGGDAGLIHSTGKNGVWTTVSIDSTHNFSYTEPNVAFDKVLNEFYLIYKKFDIVNSISRIYFQSKQNDTGIDESDNLSAKDYELFQNYPNPFNNQTSINYSINDNAYVKLSIYNSKGELISNFINQKQNRGRHSFVFNSDKLNSGVYYYRLEVDGKLSTTRKMLYLK